MRSAGCLILYSGLCVLVVLPSAKVQVARIIRHPSDLSLFSSLSSPSFRFSAYDVSCWIGRADRGLFSVMGMAAAQRRPLNCQDSLWHTFVFMLGQAFVSSNANWLEFEQHSNDRNDCCAELAIMPDLVAGCIYCLDESKKLVIYFVFFQTGPNFLKQVT